MPEANNMERWNKGLAVMEQVYGPGSGAIMAGREGSEYIAETVNHLFGDIWSLPELSIRDKRLLVVGATAMLGRADLIAIQLAGAIANGELTDAQLDEMPLLMMFYVGGGNTTALFQGIQQAKARAREMAETNCAATDPAAAIHPGNADRTEDDKGPVRETLDLVEQAQHVGDGEIEVAADDGGLSALVQKAAKAKGGD